MQGPSRGDSARDEVTRPPIRATASISLLGDFETLEVDYLKKNLKLKIKKGRTFDFADARRQRGSSVRVPPGRRQGRASVCSRAIHQRLLDGSSHRIGLGGQASFGGARVSRSVFPLPPKSSIVGRRAVRPTIWPRGSRSERARVSGWYRFSLTQLAARIAARLDLRRCARAGTDAGGEAHGGPGCSSISSSSDSLR